MSGVKWTSDERALFLLLLAFSLEPVRDVQLEYARIMREGVVPGRFSPDSPFWGGVQLAQRIGSEAGLLDPAGLSVLTREVDRFLRPILADAADRIAGSLGLRRVFNEEGVG